MAGITAIKRKGFRGGGMDAGAGQDYGGFSGGDNSPAAGGTTGGTTGGNTGGNGGNNNQNTGNDNTDMQNYMEDQTTYTANNTTTNPTISDKDRDDFFETPVGKTYKEAAEKAAAKKAEEKEKARIEKDRIDAILAKYKDTEPVAYSYGPPIKNYKKKWFIKGKKK